jgi:hypothetical protein
MDVLLFRIMKSINMPRSASPTTAAPIPTPAFVAVDKPDELEPSISNTVVADGLLVNVPLVEVRIADVVLAAVWLLAVLDATEAVSSALSMFIPTKPTAKTVEEALKVTSDLPVPDTRFTTCPELISETQACGCGPTPRMFTIAPALPPLLRSYPLHTIS